ncbi:MAG: dTDP-4-dehydrorhamnose 3,5-epimerase family protein [Gammaproteobacteria bacterium]|nr:dTDP-4-dehydrorhamnose 3,5-epimerase family protein [Gammaproteobacteria bacterium]
MPVQFHIDGVQLHRLTVHADDRGSFTEIFSTGWNAVGIEPAQWSLVESRPGTLRGMHLHRRHDELFCVVRGRAWVGLRDIRPGSPTEGTSMLLELDNSELTALIFPRGIVHGWYFREHVMHLQSVSEPYSIYGDDDNLGCNWSDPDLGIDWPDTPVRVSQRARNFPSLGTLIRETLRRDPGFSYQNLTRCLQSV